jgi:tetratricopeptide (TPR) repeat protein
MSVFLGAVLTTASLSASHAQGKEQTDPQIDRARSIHAEGMKLFAAGDRAKAITQFNAATEIFRDYQDRTGLQSKGLRALFSDLLKNEPGSPVYNYLLGRVIQLAGADSLSTAIASTYFNSAIKIEPDYPWTYLAVGYPLFQSGKYEEAAESYKKSIEKDPSFESGYLQLISCYQKTGNAAKVADVRKSILAKIPHSSSALRIRLEQARSTADPAEKVQSYRDILAVSNDDDITAGIFSELIPALGVKSPDSAAAFARSIVRSVGKQFQLAKQRAYLFLWDRAKPEGETAMSSVGAEIFGTTDAFLNRTLGKYYLDSVGDQARAMKYLQRASQVCTKDNALNTLISGTNIPDEKLELAANSFNAVIANDLGWLYFQQKDYANAEAFLSLAAKGTKDVQIPRSMFRLGDAYLTQGKIDQAIASFARGLALQEDADAMQKLVALTGNREAARLKIRTTRIAEAPPAGEFALLSLDGDSVRLSRLKGKVVLVDFWATWCGPCQHEMPYLQKLSLKYSANADVKFLSISTDQDRTLVKPFIDRNKFTMKVLYGEGTDQAYGVTGIPTLCLVDRAGKIQYRHVGFSGDGEGFIKILSGEIDELLAKGLK